MDTPSGESLTASNFIIGLVSGGIINCGLLLWLAMQYINLKVQVAVLQTQVKGLTREVSYVNGRAEADEDDDK